MQDFIGKINLNILRSFFHDYNFLGLQLVINFTILPQYKLKKINGACTDCIYVWWYRLKAHRFFSLWIKKGVTRGDMDDRKSERNYRDKNGALDKVSMEL